MTRDTVKGGQGKDLGRCGEMWGDVGRCGEMTRLLDKEVEHPRQLLLPQPQPADLDVIRNVLERKAEAL